MAIVKVDATTVTTHLLVNRQAACGTLRGEPVNWPPGHHWVRTEKGYLVSCPQCRRLLAEIHAERSGK